jgi:uncharacterized OB-fold protein
MKNEDIFEVELVDTYHYRMSYGGQSPFFRGLENRKLIGGKCPQCGFVWLPMRPVCSHCYAETELLDLGDHAELLTSIVLPKVPDHLKFLGAPVASALVRIDGADTCMKAFVVSPDGNFAKGTRLAVRYLPQITTIADFFFTTES